MLNIRNRKLKAVYDIYYERMEEAKTYLSFMKDIKYCNAIQADNKKVDISSLKYIINSSLSIILYNIIESATSGMIESIHQDLIDNQIKHHELNPTLYKKFLIQLSQMSKKDVAKLAEDYNENSTLNEKVILLEIERRRIFNGNIDCQKIKSISKDYGFSTNPNNNNNWLAGDILYIKSKRNELAHGVISFTDYGRSINTDGARVCQILLGETNVDVHNNIEKKLESVEKWLICLFENIDDYLTNQQYKKLT